MVDKRASDTEFVSSIVDLLRRRHSKLTCPEREVRTKLSEAIAILKAIFSVKGEKEWFSKENRQYAKKLLPAINKLEKLISAAPDKFFLPGELKKIRPRTGRLADLCIYMSDSGGTSKDKRDRDKEMAAACALAAMKKFSNQGPSAGDANSTLCLIASHLFEAATGEHEPNLQRSCKHVLSKYRQDGPPGWFGDSILNYSVFARMRLKRFADVEGLDRGFVSSILSKLRKPPSKLARAARAVLERF
jgi:hypothetical protein